MEKKQEMLQIGIITNSHGIHGEVKVLPTTDNPERFCELKEIILDKDGLNLTLEITWVKFFKQYVILKFKEFDHIEEIEKYKGKDLFVTRENAVQLEEDEYFIADLLGLTVQADDGNFVGQVGLHFLDIRGHFFTWGTPIGIKTDQYFFVRFQ